MTLYGSFQNRIMERDTETVPEIGIGATELCYTDRYPYTVVKILSKSRIIVQADNYEPADNEPMSNNWKYSRNPEGTLKTLIKTKRGWKVLKGSTYFRLNMRQHYYDYSF